MNRTSPKINLYTLLNVPQTATKEEIKKAYRVLVMKVHPDKNPNDENASDNFSSLHNAYTVLMDDDKRQYYDETGEIDDKVDIDLEGAYEYYKNIYPTITQKDIDDYALKYRDSKMEKDDLIEFYLDNKGDVTNILEFIPLSINDDKIRFPNIYEELIASKVLNRTKNFTKTKNKIKSIKEDNPEEVEKETEKFKDLCSQIISKKTQRGNYLNNMKNKFCMEDDFNEDDYNIDEEEFKKIQSKMKKKKNK